MNWFQQGLDYIDMLIRHASRQVPSAPISGISAPVLTRTSSAGVSPLTWTIDIDATVFAGYYWRLEVATVADFSVLTQNIRQIIIPADLITGDVAFPAFVQPTQQYYLRMRIERDDGTNSAYSNVLSDFIVPVLPRLGSLLLWLEAADLATQLQTIAGTGAVAADGDPVGTWNDKSGAGNHFTAYADNNSRPTHRSAGGIRRVEFDGVNDVLRRLAAIGMFAAGACTVMIVKKTAASQQGFDICEAATGGSNPLYGIVENSGADFKDATAFIKNDSGTVCFTTTVLKTAAWPVNTDTVFLETDSGALLTAYKDNVVGSPSGYSRTAPFTAGNLNITTIGARGSSNTPSTFAKADYYAIAVWSGVHSAQDRVDCQNYGNYVLNKVV